VFSLDNPIRDYAWGSHTHIPRILGRQRSETPVAEMWLGAHPAAPSRLADGRSLGAAIAADRVEFLGAAASTADGHLPFLMKLLAAAEPLSLQVHPTAEQARTGFAREEALGVARDAPERNYVDRSHKPELIFALTRFEGMAGLREPAKSADILSRFGLDWLNAVGRALQAPDGLRAVVSELLGSDPEVAAARIAEVGAIATELDAKAHQIDRNPRRRLKDRDDVDRESLRVFAQTAMLAGRYPRDPGVLVTLLLNHVVLARGEAMFLDAGVIHAYTSGFGVEVMASSDNVLRAGLTPKHVDVPELLAITDFSPMPAPIWTNDGDPDTVDEFRPPVAEFAVSIAEHPTADLPAHGPRILLCLDEEVEVTTSAGSQTLTQGQSVFLTDAEGQVTVDGEGRVAMASVPL
jgi:mannose-6-phosphate isomerase